MLIDHFETEGWTVKNVGTHRSYDLRCTRDRRILHVHVKGTTGALGSIALTAGEVEDAHRHKPGTALFVLHSILLGGNSTAPSVRGGQVHLEEPWAPEDSRLRPIAYSYRVA